MTKSSNQPCSVAWRRLCCAAPICLLALCANWWHSQLTYRSYCTSFPKASQGLRTTNKWRNTQICHHPWLYETRMLKLSLRCTGTTSYDSNQQLSLQATINPAALFMKPDATSAVPNRPAAAENSPGRSLLPTEATATRPRARSSGTLRKEGSNTARGCRESMQDKEQALGILLFSSSGFPQPVLRVRKRIFSFNGMHFYLALFLSHSVLMQWSSPAPGLTAGMKSRTLRSSPKSWKAQLHPAQVRQADTELHKSSHSVKQQEKSTAHQPATAL